MRGLFQVLKGTVLAVGSTTDLNLLTLGTAVYHQLSSNLLRSVHTLNRPSFYSTV